MQKERSRNNSNGSLPRPYTYVYKYSTESYALPEVEKLFVYTGEIDTQRYYYGQLSQFEQEMYKRLEENKENFICNKEFIWVTADEMSEEKLGASNMLRVLYAYELDEPLATMWLNDPRYEDNENGDIILVIPEGRVAFGSFESEEETRRALSDVEEEAKAFVSTLYGSDEQKHRQIYSYLSSGSYFAEEDIWSDAERPLWVWTVYSCLDNSSYTSNLAVCEGFSRAYKYLADLAGLEVLMIFGTSTEEEYLNQLTEEQNMLRKLIGDEPLNIMDHVWNAIYTDATGWTLGDITWEKHFYRSFERVIGESPIYDENGEMVGGKDIMETCYETSYCFFMGSILEHFEEGYHIPLEFFVYPF